MMTHTMMILTVILRLMNPIINNNSNTGNKNGVDKKGGGGADTTMPAMIIIIMITIILISTIVMIRITVKKSEAGNLSGTSHPTAIGENEAPVLRGNTERGARATAAEAAILPTIRDVEQETDVIIVLLVNVLRAQSFKA
mmetsp:Transcript_7809/g.11292  ORF Transcript_7809/g.11292 Transcript_7809/m.11292 type:complete len:140 (-) Transcript_7809:344-763(-)